jgi:hypothetical protein
MHVTPAFRDVTASFFDDHLVLRGKIKLGHTLRYLTFYRRITSSLLSRCHNFASESFQFVSIAWLCICPVNAIGLDLPPNNSTRFPAADRV